MFRDTVEPEIVRGSDLPDEPPRSGRAVVVDHRDADMTDIHRRDPRNDEHHHHRKGDRHFRQERIAEELSELLVE